MSEGRTRAERHLGVQAETGTGRPPARELHVLCAVAAESSRRVVEELTVPDEEAASAHELVVTGGGDEQTVGVGPVAGRPLRRERPRRVGIALVPAGEVLVSGQSLAVGLLQELLGLLWSQGVQFQSE